MNLWADAFDSMNAIDSNTHLTLTLDQKLKLAEIKALLAIGQELNGIHHNGINPDFTASKG